jgi:hypothetical protein
MTNNELLAGVIKELDGANNNLRGIALRMREVPENMERIRVALEALVELYRVTPVMRVQAVQNGPIINPGGLNLSGRR